MNLLKLLIIPILIYSDFSIACTDRTCRPQIFGARASYGTAQDLALEVTDLYFHDETGRLTNMQCIERMIEETNYNLPQPPDENGDPQGFPVRIDDIPLPSVISDLLNLELWKTVPNSVSPANMVIDNFDVSRMEFDTLNFQQNEDGSIQACTNIAVDLSLDFSVNTVGSSGESTIFGFNNLQIGLDNTNSDPAIREDRRICQDYEIDLTTGEVSPILNEEYQLPTSDLDPLLIARCATDVPELQLPEVTPVTYNQINIDLYTPEQFDEIHSIGAFLQLRQLQLSNSLPTECSRVNTQIPVMDAVAEFYTNNPTVTNIFDYARQCFVDHCGNQGLTDPRGCTNHNNLFRNVDDFINQVKVGPTPITTAEESNLAEFDLDENQIRPVNFAGENLLSSQLNMNDLIAYQRFPNQQSKTIYDVGRVLELSDSGNCLLNNMFKFIIERQTLNALNIAVTESLSESINLTPGIRFDANPTYINPLTPEETLILDSAPPTAQELVHDASANTIAGIIERFNLACESNNIPRRGNDGDNRGEVRSQIKSVISSIRQGHRSEALESQLLELYSLVTPPSSRSTAIQNIPNSPLAGRFYNHIGKHRYDGARLYQHLENAIRTLQSPQSEQEIQPNNPVFGAIRLLGIDTDGDDQIDPNDIVEAAYHNDDDCIIDERVQLRQCAQDQISAGMNFNGIRHELRRLQESGMLEFTVPGGHTCEIDLSDCPNGSECFNISLDSATQVEQTDSNGNPLDLAGKPLSRINLSNIKIDCGEVEIPFVSGANVDLDISFDLINNNGNLVFGVSHLTRQLQTRAGLLTPLTNLIARSIFTPKKMIGMAIPETLQQYTFQGEGNLPDEMRVTEPQAPVPACSDRNNRPIEPQQGSTLQEVEDEAYGFRVEGINFPHDQPFFTHEGNQNNISTCFSLDLGQESLREEMRRRLNQYVPTPGLEFCEEPQ